MTVSDAREKQLMARLAELIPSAVTCRVARHGSSRPVLLDPATRSTARSPPPAATSGDGGGVAPSGGSLRAAELFTRHGVPTALLGFAPPDDRAHGPIEWLPLENLERAAGTVVATLLRVSM